MAANKHLPHVQILPEDDANRQIANGFRLQLSDSRKMAVLPVAGGWRLVLDSFLSTYVAEMDRCANRFMVLLIDLDGSEKRLRDAIATIPVNLTDRVFVLGSLTEPEDLKLALGSFETIGSNLAIDCRDDSKTTWNHEYLRHNAGEVGRLREIVRPILFP